MRTTRRCSLVPRWCALGLALASCAHAAPAAADPPDPAHPLTYEVRALAAMNPGSLYLQPSVIYRRALYDARAPVLSHNEWALQVGLGLSTASLRPLVRLTVLPLSILRLWVAYEGEGYFGTSGFARSFPSPASDYGRGLFSPPPDGPAGSTGAYSLWVNRFELGARPQVQLGPWLARSSWRAVRYEANLRGGDRVLYDPWVDTVVYAHGWAVQSDTDLAYDLTPEGTSESGALVGARFTLMLREIAAEEGLSLRLATIKSDQSPAYLQARFRQGRIRPLDPAPRIDEETLASGHVVGMMGAEPIAAAIAARADVVLAGRASDAALFAAVPLARGAHPGLAWHAAKTLECGAACAVVHAADGMFATLRDDHFDVEPLDEDARCTPRSIAAHTLYENADPFRLTEPSGVIDTEEARYDALDDRSVRVSGSRFVAADEYTVKLEGARLAGYQTIAIGGVRDPFVIGALTTLIPKAQAYFAARIAELFGSLSPADVDVSYRLYGLDAVMGAREPPRPPAPPHEIGVLITVTAPTQDLATKIATLVAHVSAHLPVPGCEGLVSTLAYPFSPPEIERGPAYRFTLNHVVVPDDPYEMFRTHTWDVRGALFQEVRP
jgi:hypothetical protein